LDQFARYAGCVNIKVGEFQHRPVLFGVGMVGFGDFDAVFGYPRLRAVGRMNFSGCGESARDRKYGKSS